MYAWVDDNIPFNQRYWHYKLRARTLDGSTHCRQSGGRHGWRRVRTRFLDILHGKVDRMFFRMMTGNHTIYPGTLLIADKPTAQFRAWLLQT